MHSSSSSHCVRLSPSDIARGFVGTQEKKGNRGYWIDRFNRNAKAPLGSPYCAAFVYYLLDSAEVVYPMKKSGLARSLVTKTITFTALDVLNKKETVKKDDIPIWQKGETIFGHAGIASADWDGNHGICIEANTSPGSSGSQSDGDGIWEKKRKIEPFNYFRIKWFTRVIRN